jgi:hypothetical protein
MVSRSRSFGPLAVIYATREQAVFDADGKRINAAKGGSILWGHLAMIHEMESSLGDGTWMKHRGVHLVHHFLNMRWDHGKASFSLASDPNPIGWGD